MFTKLHKHKLRYTPAKFMAYFPFKKQKIKFGGIQSSVMRLSHQRNQLSKIATEL